MPKIRAGTLNVPTFKRSNVPTFITQGPAPTRYVPMNMVRNGNAMIMVVIDFKPMHNIRQSHCRGNPLWLPKNRAGTLNVPTFKRSNVLTFITQRTRKKDRQKSPNCPHNRYHHPLVKALFQKYSTFRSPCQPRPQYSRGNPPWLPKIMGRHGGLPLQRI